MKTTPEEADIVLRAQYAGIAAVQRAIDRLREASAVESRAAAFEEAAKLADEYRAISFCGRRIAEEIRQIAAAEKPCGACGNIGCTEIHADESAITHNFGPGAYGNSGTECGLIQAHDAPLEWKKPHEIAGFAFVDDDGPPYFPDVRSIDVCWRRS